MDQTYTTTQNTADFVDYTSSMGGSALFDLGFLFSIVLFLGILMYSIYAILLWMRVKVLASTIFIPSNSIVQLLALINVLVILVGGILVVLMI